MPVFDVLTINEKHLARVRVVRNDNMIYPVTIAPNIQSTVGGHTLDLAKWHKHVAKQCNPKKHLTTAFINRIFE